MQNTKKIKINYSPNLQSNLIVAEPAVFYNASPGIKKIPSIPEFSYNKFVQLSNKVPFTQKDWAAILNLSEKTLQRYAKSKTGFSGIYADRLYHIEQLINMGLVTFNSAAVFYEWLKTPKNFNGLSYSFESLYHSLGIQQTIMLVGRILHNVYQ